MSSISTIQAVGGLTDALRLRQLRASEQQADIRNDAQVADIQTDEQIEDAVLDDRRLNETNRDVRLLDDRRSEQLDDLLVSDRLNELRRNELIRAETLDRDETLRELSARVSSNETVDTLTATGALPVIGTPGLPAASGPSPLTQSAASGTQTGSAISTDPLHVLPQQQLPGLVDTGDAVALLLAAGVVPSDLVDEADTGPQNFPDGGPGDPFAGIATENLRQRDVERPDLDARINERVEIIPAGIAPVAVGAPEFAPETTTVIPAIPGQPLPNVNSDRSDLLNSFQRPSRQAANQQRERRSSTGLDS